MINKNDPWAEFQSADTPAADPWAEFKPAPAPKRRQPAGSMSPTGEAYDGDTFRLDNGQNARLFGYDAFERTQQGQARDGSLVPLGQQSRSALLPYLSGASVTPAGPPSYGRPVVSLGQGGLDPVVPLLQQGRGLAAPDYLANSPLLRPYMEAERFARQNRAGAFNTTFATPKEARQGNGSPWAAPEAGQRGNSVAVFGDEPMPFQGLRPEIEKGYLSIWQDMRSKPDDLIAYATANGFSVDPDTVRKQYASRAKTRAPSGSMTYTRPPRLLTDAGDGRLGATMRGVADPINVLDELGAVADTLTGVGGRESLWNSDRRFGDIYANNLEQNRSILANDEAEYPWWRFSGQLGSGVLLPGGSVGSVGLNAARTALRSGASRYAATLAAERALRNRLAIVGALEGGAAGGGQGETGSERVAGALIGAPVGGTLGVAAGYALPAAGRLLSRRTARNLADAEADPNAHQFVNGAGDTLQADAEDYALGDLPGSPDVVPLRSTNLAERAAERRSIVQEALRASQNEYLGRQGQYVAAKMENVAHDDGAPIGPALDDAANDDDLADLAANAGDAAYARRQTQLEDAFAREFQRANPYDGGLSSEVVARLKAYDAETARLSASMTSEFDAPTLYGPDVDGAPRRVVDRIDLQQPRRLADGPTDWQRYRAAEALSPRDLLPLPSNTVDGLDEALRIERGRIAPVRAPNETDALASRSIRSPNDYSKSMAKRGPLDLVTWLRTQGGIKPQGGELAHAGIDNTPRKGMDFAGGEGRFGKLVSGDGMGYDDAAYRAWEAGYFPDLDEAPTPAEFLDALTQTHRGNNRHFLPEDYAEVDNFLARRDERYRVEAAEDAGAPLSVDRGQPVDMADLDANSAPVTAYEEWGENAPNFAGNINLTKLDSPQSIKRALVQVERVSGGFDAATRGRIRQAETEALAADLNMTPRKLLERRRGEAFNAEQALAARQILAKSGNELVNAAKRISNGTASDLDKVAFREAIVRHAAIQEQVAGAAAEAGRALSSFRMVASSSAVKGRVLEDLVRASGGINGIMDAANAVIDAAADPARLNSTVKTIAKPGWQKMATELYINALLSGVRTHAVNVVSNTITALAQIPENAVAAGVGAARRAIPSQRDTDAVLFSELGARSIGLLNGTREGLAQFARTLRTGETSDLASKVDGLTQEAIPGLAGKVVRVPTRLLAAEDELFKAMARRSEIASLAVRQARREGLQGAERKARAAELTANPTPEMTEQASDFARYATFQRPLGAGGQAILNLTEKNPALKLFVPFIRTPVNLLKFSIERSPAAPLLREWRQDIAAGGARRDLATARLLFGTGAIMTALMASEQGMITGNGPADEKAKNLLRADGWQPYSFKVGDRYYSYQRLDPYSTTLGLAADYRDLQEYMTDKEREQTSALLAMSALQNLGSKTWLSGMANLSEAVADPERNIERVLGSTVASLAVPALVSQAAPMVDPFARDARSVLDRIRARIPYASRGVAVRRDVLGQPVPAGNGGGLAAFSPVYTSDRRNDLVANALLSSGVGLSKPGRSLTNPDTGERETLTPEQYDTYQRLTGDVARPALGSLVQSPSWAFLNRDQRADAVSDTMRAARAVGKRGLFGRASEAAPSDPWAEFTPAR